MHLRWWIAEETVNAYGYGEHWKMTQARAADLTLFLGTPPVPAVTPRSYRFGDAVTQTVRRARRYDGPAFDLATLEDQPGAIEPWQAVAAIRTDTPYSRSLHVLDGMGEAFAALSLICGGLVVIGPATLT